jgi:hypothetical protein
MIVSGLIFYLCFNNINSILKEKSSLKGIIYFSLNWFQFNSRRVFKSIKKKDLLQVTIMIYLRFHHRRVSQVAKIRRFLTFKLTRQNKTSSLVTSRARPLSFLITIRFGALKFWKIFNRYQRDVGSNRVTSWVIADKWFHCHYHL